MLRFCLYVEANIYERAHTHTYSTSSKHMLEVTKSQSRPGPLSNIVDKYHNIFHHMQYFSQHQH